MKAKATHPRWKKIRGALTPYHPMPKSFVPHSTWARKGEPARKAIAVEEMETWLLKAGAAPRANSGRRKKARPARRRR